METDIRKISLDFLSNLEGYHQRLKELHWSTTCKAEHLLTDEMDGDILKFEDRISEAVMGAINTRFHIGDLKTMSPSSKTLETLIKELQNDISSLRNKVSNYNGIVNILDDFTEKTYTWDYLRTLS